MAVTDIVREEYKYTDDWESPAVPDLDIALTKYNRNRNRFIFFPWGVWVTAYSRARLWSGIIACSKDYIYSDTDSIKIRHGERYRDYIEKYNRSVRKSLEKACSYHGIPVEMTRPKTIKGEEKELGVWDFDGHYTRFKTLGAKRYMVEHDNGEIQLTVSGVNKKVAMPYLLEKYGNDVFDAFRDGLEIPPGKAGKLTHTYIDTPIRGTVTDYLGVSGEYAEETYIHMEDAGYNLGMAGEYLAYLEQLSV